MVGGINGKHKWKFPFHRSSSPTNSKPQTKHPPDEFICPISGFFMSDPVVVASGHTFERISVQVCTDLSFSPDLKDGTRPDFSTVIPNLAIKTTISNWCKSSGAEYPTAPDYTAVERVVRAAMASSHRESPAKLRVSERELLKAVADNPPLNFSHAATELFLGWVVPWLCCVLLEVKINNDPFMPREAESML